ncbi:MAG: asparagine synthase C-terminal domain-containing protein, partial [Candidatus Parcubacteria bacterium]|nr:asparagine synthase C-terminal domain-containing protein [Candidatus Parcubacteria bacterium]
YLQEDILMKTDRVSMAVGLEVRAPLLDHELVEFVNCIPNKFKLRGFTTKYIFKKLMENKIPKSIVYRSKKGFGIPIASWIRNDLKDFTRGLLDSNKIKRENIFNPSFVNLLLKDHLSGRKDNRKLLWTLMAFEMWLEKWGK